MAIWHCYLFFPPSILPTCHDCTFDIPPFLFSSVLDSVFPGAFSPAYPANFPPVFPLTWRFSPPSFTNLAFSELRPPRSFLDVARRSLQTAERCETISSLSFNFQACPLLRADPHSHRHRGPFFPLFAPPSFPRGFLTKVPHFRLFMSCSFLAYSNV